MFLSGAALLLVIVAMVQRVMAERARPSRARRRWMSRRYSSILCLCFRWRHGRFFLSSCTPPVCRGSGTRGRGRRLGVVRRGRLMTATILTVTLDASTSTNNRACCAGRPRDERAASR